VPTNRGPKTIAELVKELEDFLVHVFGQDFLVKELEKLGWKPKGRPQDYSYLVDVNIHRAARWYAELKTFEERGYAFDLRFSLEVEEFMELLLFYYSFRLLLEKGIVNLKSKTVQGRLHERAEKFDDFLHEILVASNYASNRFRVSMPEASREGDIDVRARKGAIDVLCECKRLRREAAYNLLAVELLQWLHSQGLNVVVDVTFRRTPKGKIAPVVEDIKSFVKGRRRPRSLIISSIRVRELPSIADAPLEVGLAPGNIEYMASAMYTGVFEGRLKIKDPKIVVFRNDGKILETIERLKRVLRKAHRQLQRENVEGVGVRKVVHVDISEVVGKVVVPFHGISDRGDVLRSTEGFCRDWLTRHPDVDSIVLTVRRLHLDPFGNPLVVVVEYRPVVPYAAPGWTVETLVIPVPRSYPAEILTNTATKLKERGLYSMALHYYRKALEIKPELKEAWNNLGDLYNRLEKPDEALKCLDRALELDPNYVPALINKGISLAKLGRWEEALICLDKALNVDPKNERAWYNKALILCTHGSFEKARKCVAKALKIDPNYELAKRLLEILEAKERPRV